MLYQRSTCTVLEVVPPGDPISDDRLRALATFPGRATEHGEPIEKAAVVFLGGAAHAQRHLQQAKRFGLEVRVVGADGEHQVIHAGATVRGTAAAPPDGVLLPVLREAAWPHVASTVHRRLLDRIDEGPWVSFGLDTPKQIFRLPASELGERTVADVEREALANLARKGFTPRRLDRQRVVLPGEYCAEAILLPDVMRAAAALLDASLLVVAVPKESLLAAVDAHDVDAVGSLVAWCRMMFDEADGRRISPLPLLVQDGGVVGLVSPRASGPALAAGAPVSPKKKPWFKFW